ncbi:HPP family protein [Carboxylicivirga caseinilyticus]|uniref:HPP family protein n=1 Tax=Carboxylicivirga caseinilyticus TaxID=3417572 RepID=UPI002AA83B87|nr:HPP family protein [uncultured Carboxylicivirga sp.]MCU4163838.1 HPP family protein [Marinilabiliaceae bacterium A049]
MKNLHRRYRVVRYIIYRQTVVNPQDHLWTFVGAFLGIGIIGFTHEVFSSFGISDKVFLIGSFGASAVLIYGATNSPLAQPRNLIGGHLISAFIGVSVYKLLSNFDVLWLNAALAVSVSIIAMQCTKTLHPPGGATALIANLGTPKVLSLGYFYILYPVSTGVGILLLIALITNNLPRDRSYPNKQLFRINIKTLANENNWNIRRIRTRSNRGLLQRNNKRLR